MDVTFRTLSFSATKHNERIRIYNKQTNKDESNTQKVYFIHVLKRKKYKCIQYIKNVT